MFNPGCWAFKPFYTGIYAEPSRAEKRFWLIFEKEVVNVSKSVFLH